MLVVSRKVGEKIIVGETITVSVEQISGNRVRIAIDAPRQIGINRAEIADRIEQEVVCAASDLIVETESVVTSDL